ncbi:MAG: hypothetical protein HN846_00110 [Candidatus Pacebacteria bacterium]|nr:hypothetical protein [Candidatus Paceibacterota bacterium]MBT3512181.1 hypothetical protein [Candidatus Paceibacterota bacterium]MBT4004908.1 hypothetical protein [Candidatus Paceibacterota bacterium]MBT4358650.1 hypothetical protein [Candidatus Paceibacterota bacterium]MBT4681355.1 hypothetical protein [Candidatus Paceibacterota bacterium]
MIKFISSFVFGFLFAWAYDGFAVNVLNKDALFVGKYRLHHSLYGLLFICLSLVNKKSFFMGFGLGIIAQHTITDGFWFVTK